MRVENTARGEHDCFVGHGAGGLIDASWCTATYAATLRALPSDLVEEAVVRPELLLFVEGQLEIYFVPFDLVRPSAKVVLVGLTPGRRQMFDGVSAAAASLRSGSSIDEAITSAKRTGGFAGPMRTNLINMLDGIGLPAALGIDSTS